MKLSRKKPQSIKALKFRISHENRTFLNFDFMLSFLRILFLKYWAGPTFRTPGENVWEFNLQKQNYFQGKYLSATKDCSIFSRNLFIQHFNATSCGNQFLLHPKKLSSERAFPRHFSVRKGKKGVSCLKVLEQSCLMSFPTIFPLPFEEHVNLIFWNVQIDFCKWEFFGDGRRKLLESGFPAQNWTFTLRIPSLKPNFYCPDSQPKTELLLSGFPA